MDRGDCTQFKWGSLHGTSSGSGPPGRLFPVSILHTMSERMTIQIKRVYQPRAKSDGYRVLVDRLWPRGVSRSGAQIDLWLKEVAPSTRLRAWFAHDPAKWAEFQRRYHAELASQEAALASLADRARRGIVTLVYSARDERHNQANALRSFIQALLRSAPTKTRTRRKTTDAAYGDRRSRPLRAEGAVPTPVPRTETKDPSRRGRRPNQRTKGKGGAGRRRPRRSPPR